LSLAAPGTGSGGHFPKWRGLAGGVEIGLMDMSASAVLVGRPPSFRRFYVPPDGNASQRLARLLQAKAQKQESLLVSSLCDDSFASLEPLIF
jgi:hypothetical protein